MHSPIVGKRILIGTWAAVLLVALVGGTLASDPAVRHATKDRLIDLDAKWFSGLGRRLYKGEHLPRIPADMPVRSSTAYDWIGSDTFLPIAHGLGPILHAGQNTVETFLAGLGLGFRLFEVDLTLTVDDHLVCFHGSVSEDELNRMTYSDYAAFVHDHGMTRCQFSDLVTLARQHREIRF